MYKKQLHGKDSLFARVALADVKEKYSSLRSRIAGPSLPGKSKQYISKLDTLSTTLKFLDQNGVGGNIKNALAKTQALQDKFQQSEEIKKFIKQRRDYLKSQWQNAGLTKQLKKINKEIYYYSEQINEYKALLKDSKKAERKALALLGKTKLYKDFMRNNSQLASLFRLPGNSSPLGGGQVGAGLQTRAQVNNLIQQQIAAGGPNAMAQVRQNLQQAQNQINQLKNKIIQSGKGSSDAEMPEGFRVNEVKGKPLLKRLDYSVNVSSQKSASFLPVSTGVALQVGYRFRQDIIAGVGFGGRIGWGHSLKSIRITYSGISIRSYAELKLKKSFWAYIGYEQNFRPEIRDIEQLKDHPLWSTSGLAGITKQMPMRSRLFKKTKLMLLWDFLSYRQSPRVSKPLVFRIGYNF